MYPGSSSKLGGAITAIRSGGTSQASLATKGSSARSGIRSGNSTTDGDVLNVVVSGNEFEFTGGEWRVCAEISSHLNQECVCAHGKVAKRNDSLAS